MENKAYLDEEELENYLRAEKPYCREERQFAALLYNIFLKEKMKKECIKYEEESIVGRCLRVDENKNISIKIKEVYFEVTLMRDYFKKNKSNFNKELLAFCLGWLQSDEICDSRSKEIDDMIEGILKTLKKKGKDYNMGGKAAVERFRGFIPEKLQKKIKNEGEINEEEIRKIHKAISLDIAKKMMNATLDILVIYESDGKLKAEALECKYSSDEGRYKDIVGVECKMQYFIQECIMCFLFGKSDIERKEHIPPYHGRNKDEKDKEIFWNIIRKKAYKCILEQERKANGIINAGVEVIRFIGPENEEQENKKKEIPIKINELIREEYEKLDGLECKVKKVSD